MEGYVLKFSSQSSALVKSFWAGKIIQTLTHSTSSSTTASGSSPSREHDDQPLVQQELVSAALDCLKRHETSLSARVFDTISQSECNESDEECLKFLDAEGTLNWEVVSQYLGRDIILEKIDLRRGAILCSSLAEHVFKEFRTEQDSKVSSKYLTWTPLPQVYDDCMSGLNRAHPAPASDLSVNVAILQISAALERALGDVFLSVSDHKQPPYLLRDLLATEELEKTFSPCAMFVLRCLIGGPSGLNLRNLTWHGFVDHKETHKVLIRFAVLLLVLVVSLGKLLPLPLQAKLVHRPFLTLLPHKPSLERVFKVDFSAPDSCSVLKGLFSDSFFILPTMLPVWEASLEAFVSGNYSVSLSLLLPSLEHGLRRVFACANNCPERVITAEADTLYTTFDEILSPVLSSGEPNCLIGEIGTAKMEMLLDLLVHPEGPRIRDKLSHGELSLECLSGGVASHLLCVAALFCVQYSLSEKFLSHGLLMKCLAAESKYVSLFHPFSQLKEEILRLNSDLSQWAAIPAPTPQWVAGDMKHCHEAAEQLHAELYSCILSQLGHCPPPAPPPPPPLQEEQEQRSGIEEVVLRVWSFLDTLFVPKQQLELTGLMRRTVGHLTRAVHQIRETAISRCSQYQERQLRSRQRTNYQVLVGNLPLYRESLENVMLFVVETVLSLGGRPATPPVAGDDLVRTIKVHEKVLQFAENFFSQTSITQNRWEEASVLCNSIATRMQAAHTMSHKSQDERQIAVQ